jgi:hypothetical protein
VFLAGERWEEVPLSPEIGLGIGELRVAVPL